MNHSFLVSLCAAILFVLLPGCGGGGGSSGDAESGGPILLGKFLDGPFVGLRYETESLRGQTDGLGRFQFRSGETLRFYVGATLIGLAFGSSELTIFTLQGMDPPEGSHHIVRALQDEVDLRFSKACNVLQLIHTLDTDGDPSNGFSLSPQVLSYVTNVPLNLDMPWRRFGRHLPYRRAINELNADDRFADVRRASKPWRVMLEEYRRLGMPLSLARYSVHADDSDANGTVDVRTTTTFRADGVRLGKAVDEGDDGTIESQARTQADAFGNVLRSGSDLDNDGTEDVVHVYSRDGAGEIAEHMIFRDGSSTPSYSTRSTYTSYGELLEFAIDSNADGTEDHVETKTFDASGYWASREVDFDADGIVDIRSDYDVDDFGNIVREEKDENVDGSIDQVLTQAFDAYGLILYYEFDGGGGGGAPDGVIDLRVTYERDPIGRVMSLITDEGADGVVDELTSFTKDRWGQILRDVRVTNGVQDRVRESFYDAQGRRVRDEWDDDGDGIIESYSNMTYGPNDVIQTVSTDTDGDGIVDRIETFEGTQVPGWHFYMP